MSLPRLAPAFAILWSLRLGAGALAADSGSPVDVASYPSLQAAIDANPGRILQLPAREYTIDAALKISAAGTELHGPARIIQTNPHEAMVRIENTRDIVLSQLSFTRSEGRQETTQAGIDIVKCQSVDLAHLRVSENHTHTSIRARTSSDVTVEGCTVIDYKGPTIDDRTASNLMGYAFKSIDGTGIQFIGVQGGVIRDNRIQELRLWPTKAVRDKYNLGTLTVVPKTANRLLSQDIVDARYTNNWHQGAGIQVTTPEESQRVIITGNYIEHPAQGLDIHADNVTIANNIICYAMIGMKTMHGAKHVLINANQFMYCDLWGVLLQPGAASHESANAEGGKKGAKENVDGGTIVSNNIFSNFGFGDQYWNWAGHHNDYPERNVIIVLFGQLEENPPIRDILITGNLVYDSGRDTVLQDGKWVKAAPRYHYALYVEQHRQPAPVNVHAYGNLLSPGLDGATNLPGASSPSP